MVVRYNNMPDRQNFRSGIKVRSQLRAGFGMGLGFGGGWNLNRSTDAPTEELEVADDKVALQDLPDWDV